MQKPLSPRLAPLGRLYEPLRGLAARIRRHVGIGHRSIWADDNGRVFTDCHASMSAYSLVGTYDALSPLTAIEHDLRLALRARASRWITDWDAEPPRHWRAGQQPKTGSPARKRSFCARVAIQATQAREAVAGEMSVSIA
jgi:hypothetical protein